MFPRAIIRATKSAVLANKKVSKNIVRTFSAPSHTAPSSDVVIPELCETLEWVLDSPPNVHQFEEPPIIVEIEHLKNLIVADH